MHGYSVTAATPLWFITVFGSLWSAADGAALSRDAGVKLSRANGVRTTDNVVPVSTFYLGASLQPHKTLFVKTELKSNKKEQIV